MNPLAELALRASILLVVGLCLWWLARNRSAETRVRLLRGILAGLVILPALWALGPRWNFDIPGMEKPAPITISLDNELAQSLATTSVSSTAARPVDYLPYVYGGIAFLLLIPAVIGAVLLRRIWNAGSEPGWKLEDEISESLDTVLVSGIVHARLADIPSPMVYGVVDRRLLLPRDFGDWSEEHRRSALLHEAAHIKRFDCAWQHVAYGVRAVYWCHPLVWFLSGALKDETELAADERAIRSGAEAADYASALVEIARTLREPGRLVRSQGVTFMNHRQLDRRVVNVLRGNRRGFTTLGSLATAAAVAAGTFFAAGGDPRKPQAEILVVPAAPITAAIPMQEVRIVSTPSSGVAIVQSAPAIARGQKRAVPGQAAPSVATTRAAKRAGVQAAPTPSAMIAPRVQGGVPAPAVILRVRPSNPLGATTIAPLPSGAGPISAAPAPARIAPSTFPSGASVAPAQTKSRGGSPLAPAPFGAFVPVNRGVAPQAGKAAVEYKIFGGQVKTAPAKGGVPVLKDIPIVGRLFTMPAKAPRVEFDGDLYEFRADDKDLAGKTEQIRHLRVDSDRQVDDIAKFLEMTAQQGKEVDEKTLLRLLESTRNLQRAELERSLATTRKLENRKLSETELNLAKRSMEEARGLLQERKLATTRDLQNLRIANGELQRARGSRTTTLRGLTGLRTYTIDTKSAKPVTLEVMIDGKKRRIQAVPDAAGVVRIRVDEKGNVKVGKG